jgi:hypothetical protein
MVGKSQGSIGAAYMSTFIVLMAICGAAAAFRLTWIFVSLVGLLIIPLFCAVMVFWSGEHLLSALLQAGAGFIALQASYVLTGFGIEAIGGRTVGALRKTSRRQKM